MKHISLAGAILAIAPSTCALAQDNASSRPLTWHLGAGYSATTGRADRYLNDGWIVSGGLDWRMQPDLPLTLRLDGHYSEYNATRRLISLGSALTRTHIDNGNGSTLGTDLDLIYSFPLGARVRGFVTAGAGVDRRRINLTQTALFNGIICDPWWGFCGVGVVLGDVLVARDSTTRFAWNTGLGVEIPVGQGAWFVDARYRRIETDRPMEYVPIEFGFRF